MILLEKYRNRRENKIRLSDKASLWSFTIQDNNSNILLLLSRVQAFCEELNIVPVEDGPFENLGDIDVGTYGN